MIWPYSLRTLKLIARFSFCLDLDALDANVEEKIDIGIPEIYQEGVCAHLKFK